MPALLENLKTLCTLPGVSGQEFPAAGKAAELLKEFASDAHVDSFGDVLGTIPCQKKNAKTILLDAHIDEIGLIVTAIDNRGFLKVSNCGGLDRRILPAQPVTIHGKQKLFAVISSKPPHLQSGDDEKKIPPLNEIFLDAGLTKEQAQELVPLGSRVTAQPNFASLLDGKVTGKSLDDRSGVAVILEALQLLPLKKLPVNLAIQFSGREETGEQGAKIASYVHDPDWAIAVDVSFGESPECDPYKCGKMGQGPMIGSSPALDYEFTDQLINIAKEQNIPYQIEVMGGRGTGTNADVISVTRGGIRTGLLSLPLRYMHTPIEIEELSDLENTARLMAKFIETAGEE